MHACPRLLQFARSLAALLPALLRARTLWNGPISFVPAYDLKLCSTILMIIIRGFGIARGTATAAAAAATATAGAAEGDTEAAAAASECEFPSERSIESEAGSAAAAAAEAAAAAALLDFAGGIACVAVQSAESRAVSTESGTAHSGHTARGRTESSREQQHTDTARQRSSLAAAVSLSRVSSQWSGSPQHQAQRILPWSLRCCSRPSSVRGAAV